MAKHLTKYFLAAVSGFLSILIFLNIMDLLAIYSRLYSKWRSFFGNVFLLAFGMGELVFVLFIVYYYSRSTERQILKRSFFAVTAIESFLFSIITILRLFLYLPIAQTTSSSILTWWKSHNFLIGGAGLVVGTCCLVLAILDYRAQKGIKTFF